MADHEHTRKTFEDAVFNRRFRASIKRNPNPPKGFGGLDFISTGCPPQAELCKRGADGEYVDDTVSAMWWGWCAALTAGQWVNGVGRDAEYARRLVVYFNREPSDDDMRRLHEAARSEFTKPASGADVPQGHIGQEART